MPLYYNGLEEDVDTFDVSRVDLAHLRAPCDWCGEELVGVEAIPVLDPFENEVHGTVLWRLFCDNCYQESSEAI